MIALAVLRRPRSALTEAAAQPRLGDGLRAVLVTGAVSALVGVLATRLVADGTASLILSALLPVLFVLYWVFDAWLVDAGAALIGRGGRRAAYLAVSGLAFVPLISYALLSLLEAMARRWVGVGLASALSWLTLPLLVWFLTLMILAIRAVYDVPTMNAFALALLPYAAISFGLLLVLVVLSALHGAGAI
jgi:hypothetical protein